MELWLLWTLAGFALLIAELVTGTFYLLVIAAGAFAGAIAAALGGNVLVQAMAGSAVALIGTWIVNIWHSRQPKDAPGGSNFLDRGQPVVLEAWANEPAGIARVKYRGASWDARVVPAAPDLAPGTTLYIEGQEGNLLLVGAAPPGK